MYSRRFCTVIGVSAFAVSATVVWAQLPSPTPLPIPTPDPEKVIENVPNIVGQITPTPTASATSTPILPDTPTPPPQVRDAMDTDNDVTVVANGLITTFHGGRPILPKLPSPTPSPTPMGPSSDPSPEPTVQPPIIQPQITVTTTSGAAVPLSPGLILIDKQGNIIDPQTVKPGTFMQALIDDVPTAPVDAPTVPVVTRIMVDQ